MTKPALTFFERPNGFEAPGAGYVRGWVCLGELEEAFWSSTSIWSINQYQKSWRAAAVHCLFNRKPILLYTDVTARASMAYHVVPHGREILIFEQIFRSACRPISRPLSANALLRERHNVSCWSGCPKALEALTRSG